MKKGLSFMFDFAVFCSLLGVGVWMLTGGNYVFGTLMLAAAGWQVKKIIDNRKDDWKS